MSKYLMRKNSTYRGERLSLYTFDLEAVIHVSLLFFFFFFLVFKYISLLRIV